MIICGPVVRHANRTQLNIWLVLDQPPESLSLTTYSAPDTLDSVTNTSDLSVIKAGERCYFCMLHTALPLGQSDGWSELTTLYYEVIVDGVPFGDPALQDILCPGSDPLPSVFLPLEHRHFIQVSCRRPHAPGQKEDSDQLARAADLLDETLRTPERPSQLFLTGDQIYADDVSPLLLNYLHDLQSELGLADDLVNLPGGKDIHRLSKLDDRHWLTRSPSGFSSSAKRSHLLTLSEYLSMYLFAFSGAGREFGLAFATHDQLKPRLAHQPANTSDGKRPPTQYVYPESRHREDLENLNCYREQARAGVRRLLANTPTYMIFDDHEVTDDWNLSKSNARQLSATEMGRYVQSNALLAYFICQHWGNQPDNATQDVERAKRMVADGRPAGWDDDWLFSRYWGYELHQSPPVAVLDTRTHREFEKRGRHALGLISDRKIAELGQRLAALPESRTLIVVSPTPVHGFSRVECLQLNFPTFKRVLDREPWSADTVSLKALESACCQLPGVENLVFFSGDVHYAFARRQPISGGVVLWQICSSACNNAPMGDSVGLKLINRLGRLLGDNSIRYLQPEDGHFFLTSDRNISVLALDDVGRPHKAHLLCRGSGENYRVTYDLKDYQETS